MAESLVATLRRLQKERDEADRRYNDALTALDRSLRPPAALPQPPVPYDEQQVTALNESWNILPAEPRASGLTGKLTGIIWRTIGPFLQRQLTFNSRLVDHINRNVAAHRSAQQATDALVHTLRDRLAFETEFQSRLMVLLQQITPYVDTKDRDTAGGALVLNASLSAMAENLGKRWESMSAREQRYEAKTAALAAGHADLRAAVGVTQQAALAVKRELESLGRSTTAPSRPEGQASHSAVPLTSSEAFTGRLDAYKYVGFEDQFRGSPETIRARFESYLPIFQGASNVLDIGCGRGEFLDLLAAKGIGARGIDLNAAMVEVCRSRGLDVAHADAVSYLSGVDDGSLGGVFAAQVVEHLEPPYLLRFLELAFHKLAPGGRLVLETLNPACWVAFFESYIRDITHAWPLHPETLKYLVMASGFPTVSIEYRSPVPEQDRLQPVAASPDGPLAEVAEAFNANVEKLNARLFTYLDYAVVARK
jgi:SAM-dependent methyltransferase